MYLIILPAWLVFVLVQGIVRGLRRLHHWWRHRGQPVGQVGPGAHPALGPDDPAH